MRNYADSLSCQEMISLIRHLSSVYAKYGAMEPGGGSELSFTGEAASMALSTFRDGGGGLGAS